MTSYLVNKEDVVNFLDNPNMKNQDGYMFAYVTSPEVLARLVPKPLTPIAPVIAGYITHRAIQLLLSLMMKLSYIV